MAWWKKALNIGGAAAKGYTDAAKEGLAPQFGKVAGSLINKRKKQGWKAYGDEAEAVGEAATTDDYGNEGA